MGPFLELGLPWDAGPFAVAEGTPGLITIRGTVFDGQRQTVPDALIETWQADPAGRLADLHGYGGPSEVHGFRGFARCGTDEETGQYQVFTVKPGRLPWPQGGEQAPHIAVSVFARGMLNRVVTRIYFADEPAANAEDPVLARVPESRRPTLLAEPNGNGYTFDIHIQGPIETVFFTV